MSRPRQVVVIDDNRDIAELACATVGSLNMSCITTSGLDEFLAALTPETDVILMDMRMPDMNGRELMDLLAARHCPAGIVLMSGVGSGSLKEAETYGRGIGLRMVGSLPKPFRVAELIEILKR